jgi:hypothetical protein
MSLRFPGLLMIFLFLSHASIAQPIENIRVPYIHTVQLFPSGNQLAYPVYSLQNGGKLALEFDDLDGGFKNYYYTFQLCDYQWKPANLNAFDYIKGFTQQKISNYRFSTIAFKRYTHYQVLFPESNMLPTRSGNYLIKVFLDGDTSKTVFSKPFLVLDSKSGISAQVVQPFTPQKYNTHQRIRFTANIKDINSFSPAQQVKAVILQNNRWDNAQISIPPTYVRGNSLEYNSEQVGVFPGGKEWRWLDLRSFRLFSDRVAEGKYGPDTAALFLKTDQDRSTVRYMYYSDFNGMYQLENWDNVNPFWQSDYARIRFSFRTNEGGPFRGKDLYLIGGFTDYQLLDKWKLQYDAVADLYWLDVPMKQGFYNYSYLAVDRNNPADRQQLDGDYWETENLYTILIYYKSLTDRNDQLIGMTTIRSRADQPGIIF